MKLHGTMKINALGNLEIGGCDTVKLVKELGSPLYVMDETLIRENCQQYYNAFTKKYGNAQVIYASKAFMTMAMCRVIEEEGLGLDVVSGGEIYTAIKADFPMERVYFHGNNKLYEELELAVKAKVGRIVVDNLYELSLLDDLAKKYEQDIPVLVRVTPGIEAHTHEYIKTGQIDSKFGTPISTGQALDFIKVVNDTPGIDFKGIHCHIGSQIFEIQSFKHAAEVMMSFVKELKDVLNIDIEEVNLGGGFGVYYSEGDTPSAISNFADIMIPTIRELAEKNSLIIPNVIVEPGRSIVCNAGTTLYKIGSIKEVDGIRKYVAVDGGMVDNPRPALYKSKYEAMVANKANEIDEEVVSITGKCCESGDMLIWDIKLPKVESSDVLAVASTGAYNYSMSMNYNRIGRPAVVFVKEGKAEVVVKREDYNDLVRNDIIPDRLAKGKVRNILNVSK